MQILKFPLARITVWFILGLLVSFYLKPSISFAFLFLGIAFLLFTISYFLARKDFVQKVYFATATYILFVFVGVSTYAVNNESYNPNHYLHKINDSKEHSISITLTEKLKSSAYNQRYLGVVNSYDSKISTGKILLNIQKEGLKENPSIGSVLWVEGIIFKHQKPHNPNQFDYGKYLENKSVYGQIYTDVSKIKVGSQIDKSIWYYAANFRNTIIQNLEKSNFSKDELNVVVALILGQQQDISPEILKDYQFAGAVHILSVSGLHVGCIMIFIGFLLRPLPKNKIGEFLKLFIIIGFLWLFALIAGFSPSVTRSVVMFSFVAFGQYANRKTNIFHTLLASIFFILLVEPSFIFDVGFQLSYFAVFFIVWLQPLFLLIWKPKNIIIKYFWDILTVSFAAQIGAFPLSVYYFHQFPGLFFVTNMLVLPLLVVIMAVGVFVMVWAIFSTVPQFIAKSLEWTIYVLNKIISWVASFESFIFQDISFNLQMMASCYLLIFSVFIWFKKPNFNKLAFALMAIVLFQGIYFETIYTNNKQEEFIVFNAKRSTIISERKGENVIVRSNDSLSQATMSFVVKPYLVGNFASVSKMEKLANLNYFNKNKILIVDSLGIVPNNMDSDVLILTKSPKINLERILQTSKPKMIVADASNFKTYTARWKETCLKEKIPFHATAEKGFYRLSKEN
ncbi:ComEC/Rec2 family competence protein [uncultured Flavobacterium sp.]|uniref:ComEC/Rec2 family competence protein n=1 Tax=uncultured Flavobacterium sp. TaxID=165435 RepID=UPI0025D0F77C|nr:ComEC/Rec2 family competence protein [uncultured Flavobacterium sp.]